MRLPAAILLGLGLAACQSAAERNYERAETLCEQGDKDACQNKKRYLVQVETEHRARAERAAAYEREQREYRNSPAYAVERAAELRRQEENWRLLFPSNVQQQQRQQQQPSPMQLCITMPVGNFLAVDCQ